MASMMITAAAAAAHSHGEKKPEVVRRSGNFHPPIWAADFFLKLPQQEKKCEDESRSFLRVEELKKKVKTMFLQTSDTMQMMTLVDMLERMGIAYHFEPEIEGALRGIYGSRVCEDDLHAVALRFRLLRQHQYNISSEVFMNLKDENGNFKTSLRTDVKGLLSLYEAAHLSIHGEDILDEALEFTTAELKAMLPHLSSSLAKHVRLALEMPLHWDMERLKAKQAISIYNEDQSLTPEIIELAKLDFNLLQAFHQKEIQDISRWWKELDLPSKLPFARDRIVELYFWILGVYFEPKYSRARSMMTKIISFTSVFDDIYDLYGTTDELQQFTDAIERWDTAIVDSLPGYMKEAYHALVATIEEFEKELGADRKYRIPYFKEAMKSLVRAYLEEANWYHSKRVPTMEECIKVGIITSTCPMQAVASCLGMDEVVKEEDFVWAIAIPKIIKGSSIVGRVMDDIRSHKHEQERGHAPTSVESYMTEQSCSEEEAYKKLREVVAAGWKDINEGFLNSIQTPKALLLRVVNLARITQVFYQHRDGYTDSTHETRDNITLALIEPVPM